MNKKILFLGLFSLALFLAISHYYHWDDRLIQLWQEKQLSDAEKAQLSWFDDYYVDIAAKQLAPAIKAEASGLAWHPQRNSLFTIAERTPSLFELDLDGNVLNSIDLINGGDVEAVTVISDGRIAVIDERRCIIFLFELTETADAIDMFDKSKVTQIDLLAQMPELNQPKNKGIEGMAWDAANSRFLLAKERNPAALFSLPYDLDSGEIGELTEFEVSNLFARDLSGLAFDPRSQNILALSHESRLLIVIDDKGNTPNFMSFTRYVNGLSRVIPQAEGVTIDEQGVLYVVSEPNLFYRFNKRLR